MKLSQNYYSILGVESDATEREILNAYRARIRVLHPDVNKSLNAEKDFMELHKAYETLSNPEKRAEYDCSIGILDKNSAFKEFAAASESIRKEITHGTEEEESDEEYFDNTPIHETLSNRRRRQTSGISTIFNLFKSKDSSQEGTSQDFSSGSFAAKPNRVKKLSKDELFGERKYNFSIDALESILGTERQLIIKDEGNKEKKIIVKIPKGIKNNSTLQIPVQTTIETKPRVHISIVDHPYLKRDELDLTLLVPFHKKETRQEETALIFTASAEIKITIPKESLKALRIKNHGLKDEKSGQQGDFMVLPVLSAEYVDEDDSITEKEFKSRRLQAYTLLKPLHQI